MKLTRHGASMAVFQNGSILLVRRARPPLAGLWSLPGGKIESGENATEAACREVLEETGIIARIIGQLGHNTIEHEEIRYVLDVFYGRPHSGALQPGDDADRACWVRLEDLQNYHLNAGVVELILAAAALMPDNGKQA